MGDRLGAARRQPASEWAELCAHGEKEGLAQCIFARTTRRRANARALTVGQADHEGPKRRYRAGNRRALSPMDRGRHSVRVTALRHGPAAHSSRRQEAGGSRSIGFISSTGKTKPRRAWSIRSVAPIRSASAIDLGALWSPRRTAAIRSIFTFHRRPGWSSSTAPMSP